MAQNQDGDELNYFSDQLVHCMEIDTDESIFGCPGCCCCGCCPGQTAKFIRPTFYPQGLKDVGVGESELYALLDQLDQVFHATGFPWMPNGFLAALSMVGLPFWLWHMNHKLNKRKKELDKVVKEWNDSHRNQGVYAEWNSAYYRTMKRTQERIQVDLGMPGLDIKVNKQARDAYLNKGKM